MLEAHWGEEPVFKWMSALALPASAWTQPFLSEIGLPPELCAQEEWLSSVQAQAAERQEAIWESVRETSPSEEWEASLTQGVVTFILRQIGAKFGDAVAENFADWARRNIVREDWAAAMRSWRTILQAPPSPVAESLRFMQQGQPFISREREINFDTEVERAAPPMTEEEQSIGFDASPLTLTLEQAAQCEWTYRALREVERTLPRQSQPDFLAWAQSIAAEKGIETSRLMTEVLLPTSIQ